MVEKLEELISRLEVAVARSEALAGGQVSKPVRQQAAENKTVREFINLITAKVDNLKKATADLNIA